jgi:demethylmenaquinone methyltransferase/2-methoxy-6-polyprenyl-1,4-benzoquinol methylase
MPSSEPKRRGPGPELDGAQPAAEEEARKERALGLFAGLPRRYDTAGAALSFGQDPRWRRAMVARVRASTGDRVLDVATGTGMVAVALVRRYGCRVVGLDQSPEMLAGAEAKLRASPELAARIELVRGEAESLPFAEQEFDHLTFTYLLRYVADPAATLAELARVVKPGGRISSLEFMLPPNPAARALWRAYTRLGLPVLGRLISRDWYEVGRFLEPSISDLYRRLPLDRQLDLWRAAGIESVQARVMSLGGGVVIWGNRGG